MVVFNGVGRSVTFNHKYIDLICLENDDAIKCRGDVNIKGTTFWVAMLCNSGEVH
jgi:hypothetical protein